MLLTALTGGLSGWAPGPPFCSPQGGLERALNSACQSQGLEPAKGTTAGTPGLAGDPPPPSRGSRSHAPRAPTPRSTLALGGGTTCLPRRDQSPLVGSPVLPTLTRGRPL